MIPKTIWQTHYCDYHDLPDFALTASRSWKTMNPKHVYNYMNDKDLNSFIRECGPEWVSIFHQCRVPVMRADLWRYLIIYKYGGVYSDMDTRCNAPIEEWVPDDKDFVIAPEHLLSFCQWTFAAAPGHPIIKSVLELIRERFTAGPDYTNPRFVHYLTGPDVWTDGIVKALKAPERRPMADAPYYNSLPEAIATKFFCHYHLVFRGGFVDHIFASENNWVYPGRQHWKDQQDDIVKKG